VNRTIARHQGILLPIMIIIVAVVMVNVISGCDDPEYWQQRKARHKKFVNKYPELHGDNIAFKLQVMEKLERLEAKIDKLVKERKSE
jgi:tellurite resistance protein